MRSPLCAYCRTVDALAWEVIGSLAGVASVIAAIVFGVIPLVQARRPQTRLAPADGALRAKVSGGQGVQVGSGNKQLNQYIQTYVEHQDLPFLAQRTGRHDEAGARELAGELGFLPLALAQAAAVIAAQHLDHGAYLARLRGTPVQALLRRSSGEP